MIKLFVQKNKKIQAFTLIELIVVIAIIGIMLAIILPNYHKMREDYALFRASHRLAQDLRRAQEMALSTISHSCPGSSKLKGYGIIFTINSDDSYSLQAMCDSNPNLIKSIYLEKEVKISGLTASPLNVFFYPPDPMVDFSSGGDSVEITLSLRDGTGSPKHIIVNKAGLIYVQP